MELDTLRDEFLAEAETLIERFLKERGGFSLFALAKLTDGRTHPIQPTDEFPDMESAVAGVFQVLVPLARDNEIQASVICAPITTGGQSAVMYDLESRENGRLLIFAPFKKRLIGGWKFGDRSFKSDRARVFAN